MGSQLLKYSLIPQEANQALRLIVLDEIPEDQDLRTQWNDLVLRHKRPQVFYTYEWALAVYRSYGEVLRPLLFLAYNENDNLCGIAALALDSVGKQVCFLCATTADYCDFLTTSEDTAFVSAVLSELDKRGLRRITLANFPVDSSVLSALRKSSADHGYQLYARTAYHCAQIFLSRLERLPDGRIALPRTRAIRRSLNSMDRNESVVLTHARSQSEAVSVLPQFIQTHVARFLATGRISNLAHRDRQRFLLELAKLLAERGWLTVSRLASGEKSFAWNYGFQFEGSWFWYQPTFDNRYAKLSPGMCLLAKIVEEAAETPAITTVDLGLGAEEYKQAFSNQTQETLYVTLRRSPVQHAAEILRYRLAELVKSSPKTEVKVRVLIGLLRDLRAKTTSVGVLPVLRGFAERLAGLAYSKTEVIFFESGGANRGGRRSTLVPLNLNVLADAACQYVEDRSTCSYLIRSAARLQEGKADGFALISDQGAILHFVWVTQFDGFFLSELNKKVDAPSADSVMIFDCWTPLSSRGHGYYGDAIAQLACRMREAGKRPWIFSAATNTSSIRGLQKAGFEKRYSMIRQRVLMKQRIEGTAARIEETLHDEIPMNHS